MDKLTQAVTKESMDFERGYAMGYNQGYLKGISMYEDILKLSVRPIHVNISDIKNPDILKKLLEVDDE